MPRNLLLVLPVLAMMSCLDPLEGRRFACDPKGPDTCAAGLVCVPVESPYYNGLCMPPEELGRDVPDSDPGSPRDILPRDPGTVDQAPPTEVTEDPSPVDPGPGEVPGDPGPEDSGPEDPGQRPDVPRDVVQDPALDGCVPDCQGRECGPDGCGGSCGDCIPEGPCRTAGCVEGRCEFRTAAGSCFIDGTCWENGAGRPGYPCQVCKAGVDPLHWSFLPTGTECQRYGSCTDQGVCGMPCWDSVISPGQPECPTGFGPHDGCHCPVPPTGVVRCARQAERISCDPNTSGVPLGQDGHFPSGPVQVEASGGAVSAWRDVATGILWWFKDHNMRIYSGAALLCGGLGAVGEWDLPSRRLLLSVMDFSRPGCGDGAGTVGGFPLWPMPFGGNCDTTNPVWTATSPAGTIETAPLLIEVSSGTCRSSNGLDEMAMALCAKAPRGPYPWTRDRFVRKGDLPGTAYDRLTGLEWDVPPGDNVQGNWGNGLSYCYSRGGGWRLPNLKELLSLMEDSRVGMCPAWTDVFGTDCRPDRWWWTSTPVPWPAAQSYAVSEDGVQILPLSMEKSASVLCVRRL